MPLHLYQLLVFVRPHFFRFLSVGTHKYTQVHSASIEHLLTFHQIIFGACQIIRNHPRDL
jgi:hypothetical protein